MSKKIKLLPKVAISITTLILISGATELSIRLWWPQPERSAWRINQELGLSHLPQELITIVEPEFTTTVVTNSQGFVDLEHAPVKPQGLTRIAVLGDSFVEAVQVPLASNFCRLLEQKLTNNYNLANEVLNFGIAGAGTAAEYLVLHKHALPYSPDLVLLMFLLSNDVLNNHPELDPKKDKPFLKLESGRLQPWTVGTNAPGVKAQESLAPKRTWLSRSHLVRLVQKRVARYHETKARGTVEGIPLDYLVFKRPAPPLWEEAWAVTSDLLKIMNAELRAQGIPLLVVAIPDRIQVYPELFEKVIKQYPRLREQSFELDYPNHRLRAICQTNGIKYFDLLPHFRAQYLDSEPLYFLRDGHWNQAGHKAVASLLAPVAFEILNKKVALE